MSKDKRKHSSVIVDGVEQAPSRAMLRAVGFEDDDFNKPQVGIASTWSMVTPCNMHINTLADSAQDGVNSSGSKAVIFNTITVSDGISMGTQGMRYSLISREVIADSIETVVGRAILGERLHERHHRVKYHRSQCPDVHDLCGNGLLQITWLGHSADLL